MTSFPAPSGNFVPVPKVLLDFLLKENLSRTELIVTLYMARLTYELGQTQTMVPMPEIVTGTTLSADQVGEALEKAVDRGTILRFKTEGASRENRYYLLNTEENRRIAGVLDDASIPGIRGLERLQEPPPPAPLEAPVPTPARLDLLPRPRQNPKQRVIGLIKRNLTRDEEERLSDLRAHDDLMHRSIDNLETKGLEIYSSDQVIYEYESLLGQIRRQEEEIRKREAASQARDRVKVCKKCKGMGYLFIGVNTVKECECRQHKV